MNAQTFLEQYFGEPNQAWPGMKSGHAAESFVRDFLKAADFNDERPLILPFIARDSRRYVHVICRDTAHASRVSAVLHASVGDFLADFSGRTRHLRTDDPIEGAIVDFVGRHSTFVLPVEPTTWASTWEQLRMMNRLLKERPRRDLNSPRPVGRMLWEFHAAIGCGDAVAATQVLVELEQQGGLSLENIAYLKVLRDARLGRDAAILEAAGVADLILSRPPDLIADALLAAWCRLNMCPDGGDDFVGLERGMELLRAERLPLAVLITGNAQQFSSSAALVGALVAVDRRDGVLAERLLSQWPTLPASFRVSLGELVPAAMPHTSLSDIRLGAEGVEAARPRVQPQSWAAWILSLADVESRIPWAETDCSNWSAPGLEDAEVAAAVEATPDDLSNELLALLGDFIDAQTEDCLAPLTAMALIERLLILDRYSPADLGIICSLLRVALTSNLKSVPYGQLLHGLASFAHLWVSVQAASRALDLVDLVCTSSRPDSSKAVAFAAAVLGPLHSQRHRLADGLRGLAQVCTSDLDLGLDWSIQVEPGSEPPKVDVGELTVLLYSLETSALRRAAEVLRSTYPGIRIVESADVVASPRLKSQVRESDVVVIATSRAAHAATYFIVAQSGGADVLYPSGGGSASMLASVETWIREHRMFALKHRE